MQAQYLSTQPQETPTLTEARKARQKRRLAGSTTGFPSNKAPCIEEKQRVRPPSARPIQKNKQKRTNTYVHRHTSMHACMYDCIRARANQRHTRHHHSSQGCVSVLYMCTRVWACAGTISLISLLCLFVCRCTP
jgi:hypothetical protein